MKAYCFRCKGQREMKNPRNFVTKNKRKGFRGVCSKCGRKVARIGGV